MGVTASGFSGMPGPARLQGVYKSVVGDSIAEPVRGIAPRPRLQVIAFFVYGVFVVPVASCT